jgi:putative SOS response-associated peptidase YedK
VRARYTLRTPADLLAARTGLPQIPDLRPRYNVSPTQPVPVFGTKAGGHDRASPCSAGGPSPTGRRATRGPGR